MRALDAGAAVGRRRSRGPISPAVSGLGLGVRRHRHPPVHPTSDCPTQGRAFPLKQRGSDPSRPPLRRLSGPSQPEGPLRSSCAGIGHLPGLPYRQRGLLLGGRRVGPCVRCREARAAHAAGRALEEPAIQLTTEGQSLGRGGRCAVGESSTRTRVPRRRSALAIPSRMCSAIRPGQSESP